MERKEENGPETEGRMGGVFRAGNHEVKFSMNVDKGTKCTPKHITVGEKIDRALKVASAVVSATFKSPLNTTTIEIDKNNEGGTVVLIIDPSKVSQTEQQHQA